MKKRKRTSIELAEAAFEAAADSVIERAIQTGTPVIVWQNEQVTELDPRKLKRAREKAKKKQERGGKDD